MSRQRKRRKQKQNRENPTLKETHNKSSNITLNNRINTTEIDRGISYPPEINDAEQEKEVLYKYILELAQQKYNFENQREQDLIHQAGQMQAAFSFLTAALFMALPVAIEYRGDIPLTYFFVSASVVSFFLILSLTSASLATWRWKKVTAGNIKELKDFILNSQDWRLFLKPYYRDSAIVNLLEEVQIRKEELNSRRSLCIHISIILFYCSLISIVICYLIAFIFI